MKIISMYNNYYYYFKLAHKLLESVCSLLCISRSLKSGGPWAQSPQLFPVHTHFLD